MLNLPSSLSAPNTDCFQHVLREKVVLTWFALVARPSLNQQQRHEMVHVINHSQHIVCLCWILYRLNKHTSLSLRLGYFALKTEFITKQIEKILISGVSALGKK